MAAAKGGTAWHATEGRAQLEHAENPIWSMSLPSNNVQRKIRTDELNRRYSNLIWLQDQLTWCQRHTWGKVESLNHIKFNDYE